MWLSVGMFCCLCIHFPCFWYQLFRKICQLPLLKAQVTQVGLVLTSTPTLNQRWDTTQVWPILQVSDSFWSEDQIQITPMSSAPKTWEALFLLRGYEGVVVVLPGPPDRENSLGTKQTWRKIENEVLNSNDIIWAPGSSLTWSSFPGTFQLCDSIVLLLLLFA